MIENFEEIKAGIIKPISGRLPAGEDPKYEDAYGEVKEEVAKMAGIGKGATDWKLVEKLSLEMLTNTAKDLNVMAYLAAAWSVNHKIPGMVAGLICTSEVIVGFWDYLYPPLKKIKIRGRALDWLEQRLLESSREFRPDDRALCQQGLEAAKRLKSVIYQRFDDPPVSFKKIAGRFEEWIIQVPEPTPEPEPEPEPPPATEPTPTAKTVSTAPTKAATPAAPVAKADVEVPTVSADAAPDEIYEMLGKVAGQLRGADPSIPVSYLLQRISLWASAKMPKHPGNKETMIPPPSDEIAEALKNMKGKASWDVLLKRSEDLSNRFPYWLDLQYYAALAAENLQHEEMLTFIEQETRALHKRLPEMQDLKFDGGKGFALPETKDWLQAILKKGTGGGGEEDPATILRSELRQLGADGFEEAMKVAQASIESAPNRREAMRKRIEVAGFCFESEQIEWCDALVRSMVDEIESHHLHYWEPQLAAKCWRLILECSKELVEYDAAYKEMEIKAMRALGGLDVGHAGLFPKTKSPFG